MRGAAAQRGSSDPLAQAAGGRPALAEPVGGGSASSEVRVARCGGPGVLVSGSDVAWRATHRAAVSGRRAIDVWRAALAQLHMQWTVERVAVRCARVCRV